MKLSRAQKMKPVANEPGVIEGPTWCVPWWSGADKLEGPRCQINGRWFSAVRASHIRFVSTRYGYLKSDRAHRLQMVRMRIGVRLGRFDDLPF